MTSVSTECACLCVGKWRVCTFLLHTLPRADRAQRTQPRKRVTLPAVPWGPHKEECHPSFYLFGPHQDLVQSKPAAVLLFSEKLSLSSISLFRS